ncbi:MAG: hypothetical protein IJ740_11335 [Ruminococcus sp.]|nr:hypothetical protein [Ruminococcus sp.]
MDRKTWFEFLLFSLVPLGIPYINEINDNYISTPAKNIIIIILASLDLFFAYKFYKNNYKEKHNEIKDKILRKGYSNAFVLSDKKKEYIISKSYDEIYRITKEQIPYDVHDYISEICKNFRDTISDITGIEIEYNSVTFIYHYIYDGANDEDRMWRWVVGKETTTHTPLNEFVEKSDSLYNYLINNRNVNSVFSNDKKDLKSRYHYYMSPRDKDHNEIGSVFSVKIDFNNNAQDFVEGILLISTYGKKFVDNNSRNMTVKDFKNIVYEELFPYYRRLIESELGMLYLKHISDKTQQLK